MGQILERKFQLSLTFAIHVTEDAIQPKTLFDEESAALPQQNRRLLLALFNAGETSLVQTIKYMLALHLGQYEMDDWETLLLGHAPSLEELLLPVINTLDPSDAAALQAAIKDDTFFQRVEDFRKCFQFNLEQVDTSRLP